MGKEDVEGGNPSCPAWEAHTPLWLPRLWELAAGHPSGPLGFWQHPRYLLVFPFLAPPSFSYLPIDYSPLAERPREERRNRAKCKGISSTPCVERTCKATGCLLSTHGRPELWDLASAYSLSTHPGSWPSGNIWGDFGLGGPLGRIWQLSSSSGIYFLRFLVLVYLFMPPVLLWGHHVTSWGSQVSSGIAGQVSALWHRSESGGSAGQGSCQRSGSLLPPLEAKCRFLLTQTTENYVAVSLSDTGT